MIRIVPNKDDLKLGADGELIRETRQTMLAISTPQSRPAELLRKLNDPEFDPYQLAYRAGCNVSTLLETLEPSKDHEGADGDAFDRLVRASGIRMQTDLARGLFADKVEAFENTLGTKRLIPELFARMYRSGVGVDFTRAPSIYLSSDYVVGGIMRPWATRQQVLRPTIQSAIPLASLIAITTGIVGEDYRGFMIDDDVDARRMKRVTEAAELPRTSIKGRETAVKTYKYGRAIEFSYEVLRRMAIDMLAVHLEMMAAQAEADKVAEVIDVLVDGDGNSNGITTVDLSDMDPDAASGEITLSAWISFEQEFENPYVLTTVLAQKGPIKQVRLLNTGSANLPLGNQILGLNTFRLINRTADNVAIGHTSDAPADKLIGFDAGKAVERVYEIGASISEMERFITRQVEVVTLTEQEGYAILDPKARKALDLTA